MILIYDFTATVLFGKDMLKMTTGPKCKQDKNIEKKSEKSGGLQMKELNF